MTTSSEQFQASFTKLTNSNVFKSTLEKLNLHNIEFEILSEKHQKEALDIFFKQFSITGGGHRGKLFDCESSDLYPYFEIVINHAIKTKFSHVAVQNSKIIYVTVTFDLFDIYSVSESFHNLSPNIQALAKYFGFIEYQNEILTKLKQNCKYGEVNYCAFGAKLPSFVRGKALAPLITAMHWVILSDMKSIKYSTHSYSHPKSAYYALNKFPLLFDNIHGLKWEITANYNYGEMMEKFIDKDVSQNQIYSRYANSEYLQKLVEKNIGWVWGLTSYDRQKLNESMDEIWIKVVTKMRPSIFSKL